MPVTAAEAMLYDPEAMSPQSTGQALANAQRLGLAVQAARYWVPTGAALDLRSALEDRFLRETE
jgi:hypothetical protein